MPSDLKTTDQFNEAIRDNHLAVVHFYADWAEQCGQINDLLDTISKQDEYNKVKTFKCPAEELSDICLQHKIEAVPTIVLFKSGKEIDRVNGVDPAKITEKIQKYNAGGDILKKRLESLINRSKVMLFMKGNKEQPRCGFSRQMIEILNGTGVHYETFDILSDEEVRQGLKEYSEWPTYPQLYVKGEDRKSVV